MVINELKITRRNTGEILRQGYQQQNKADELH
jgi:hypothetical protein